MKKQKGINARAWFYSTSFHSGVEFTEVQKERAHELKEALDQLRNESEEHQRQDWE